MKIEKITHKLTTEYISDDTELTKLIESHLKKHETILLIAPQGTGKTTYIEGLQEKDYIPHVVGLFPTRMLKDQQKKTQFQKQYGIEGGFSNTTTFCSGESYYEWMEREGLSNPDNLIFIDEIHKIIQYSSFAYESQTIPALSIIDEAKENPCILATATPDYLYQCCTEEPFYKSIDIIIEVEATKDYIKHLTLLDGYTNKDSQLKALIMENHQPENKQIVLLNSTKKCDAWAEEFKQSGIHAVSIHSKADIQNPTIKPIYKSITENGKLNCEILFATSWIDIGVSFKDENITNLYCILNDNWTDGDFTMIKQFMARARKSIPHLYITRPQMTYTEQKYIKDMKAHSETNGQFSPGTDFYKELEEDIIHTAGIQAELINRHKVGYKASDSTIGCLKLGGQYIANTMHCKYYLYTLYEKQQIEKFKNDDITKGILSDQFNIEVDQIDIQTYTPEPTGLTPEEEQAVVDYLEELYTTQEKFTQEEFCTTIRTITNEKKGYQKAGQFLKNTVIGNEPLNKHFNPARKNGGGYQLEKF